MVENWRDVPGFEGRYMVSDQGRVRSLLSGKMLALAPDRGGYLLVCLVTSPGKHKTAKVHHLVLSAFVGPKPPGHIARHRDGVRTRNVLSNLAWGTAQENADDRRAHGKTYVGLDNPNVKLTPKDVRFIREFPRYRGAGPKLAAQFGVKIAAISKIWTGRSWRSVETSGG